jgi:hypothetical protein
VWKVDNLVNKIILIILIILAGCSVKVAFNEGLIPDKFEVFERGMHESYTISDAVRHSKYIELKKFITNKDIDWKSDLVTYAPDIYMRSDVMTINLHRATFLVIINYRNNSNEWLQVSAKGSQKIFEIFNNKEN